MKGINRSTCPFCQPSIEENVFFENDKFRAIYNLAPILPGHSLVIPKQHILSIFEFRDKELAEFVDFSRETIRILQKAFRSESFNWTLQEKEEAGQTQAHLHIHIIPRIKGDLPDPGDWYPKLENNINRMIDSELRPKLKDGDLKNIIGRLKSIAKTI